MEFGSHDLDVAVEGGCEKEIICARMSIIFWLHDSPVFVCLSGRHERRRFHIAKADVDHCTTSARHGLSVDSAPVAGELVVCNSQLATALSARKHENSARLINDRVSRIKNASLANQRA